MSMDDFIKTLNDEQKAALFKMLSSSIEESKQDQENIGDNFTTTKKPLNNNRRREPVRARKNEWVDTGEFRDENAKYGERTPRNRQPHKKMEVECSVCGKSFKVDPRYTYGEYHRCSKCVGR